MTGGRSRRLSGLVGAALLLGLWAGGWSPALGAPRETAIARVLDGLTLETPQGETIRLLGLHPLGFSSSPGLTARYRAEARAFMARRLQGKAVRLEFDLGPADREGRLLAYVRGDGELLNEELLRAGLAEVRAQPPNLRYHERFVRAQREAVEQRRGVWGDPAAMDAYEWTPGGVIGRETMPLFYHHADPELDRLPFGEHLLYFDSPSEAAQRGWAPALNYTRWAGWERDRLVGDRPVRTGIPPEIRREAELPPPPGTAGSVITSVSGPEVFGLADGTLVRLDGIEVAPEGRQVAGAWRGRAVGYAPSGPASLGVRPVLLWVDGALAQVELIAHGMARLSATAVQVFGEAQFEKLRRLEMAARAARLGAWAHKAPRWMSSYVVMVPPTPFLAREEPGADRPQGKPSTPPAEAAPPPSSLVIPGVVLGPPGVIVQVLQFFVVPVPVVVKDTSMPTPARSPAGPPLQENGKDTTTSWAIDPSIAQGVGGFPHPPRVSH